MDAPFPKVIPTPCTRRKGLTTAYSGRKTANSETPKVFNNSIEWKLFPKVIPNPCTGRNGRTTAYSGRTTAKSEIFNIFKSNLMWKPFSKVKPNPCTRRKGPATVYSGRERAKQQNVGTSSSAKSVFFKLPQTYATNHRKGQ